MRAAVTVPIVAMAQVAAQTRKKLVPNVGFVNLSHQPLSQAQEAVLAHGPYFAVTLKIPTSKNI